MTVLIIIVTVIVYVLTLAIWMYIIAKDDDSFDTVGQLCGWIYAYHPIIFRPGINTLLLIIAGLLYPIAYVRNKIFERIARIKLPKRKNCHDHNHRKRS